MQLIHNAAEHLGAGSVAEGILTERERMFTMRFLLSQT